MFSPAAPIGTAGDISYVYLSLFPCLIVFIQFLMHVAIIAFAFTILHIKNQEINTQNFIRKIFCVFHSFTRSKKFGYAKFWNF